MPEMRQGRWSRRFRALCLVLSGLAQWLVVCAHAETPTPAVENMTAQALSVNTSGPGLMTGGFPGAVPEYLVDTWLTEQGLLNNSVNALLQTRDGFIWVGTASGLMRFDGLKFTPIVATDAPEGKPEAVTALCEDREGSLWIGTQAGGLLRYADKKLARFTVHDGLLDNSVTIVAQDSWGTLWVGTQSGLNRWQKGRFSEYRNPKTGSMKLITGIHANKAGQLWITTLSGIYELRGGELEPLNDDSISPEARSTQFLGVYGDSAGNLWGYGDTFLRNLNQGKRYNYFRSSDPTSSRVCTLCERHNGELWVGTKGSGLYCLSNGEFKAIEVNSDSLRNDVRAILEDTEGNLWIGTSGGGLVRLKPRRFWFLGAGEGLPAAPLNTLCIDPERRVWAGSTGAGLYSGQPLQFQRVRPGGTFNFMNYIWSICVDAQEGIWAGSWGGGLFHWKESGSEQYTTADGLSDEVIVAVAADPKGGVWAGTQSGVVHFVKNGHIDTYAASDGPPFHAVRSLLVRHNGSVWAGFENGGLSRLADGRFVPVITDDRSRATVSALFEDSADRLWIGTLDNGLGCLVSTRLYWCGSEQGLPDDSIFQIIDDEKGDLWLGSQRGISQTPKTGIEKFARGTSRVLPTILCEQEPGLVGLKVSRGWPAAIRSGDGKLWFATSKGIAVLDPVHLTPNGVPPPVIIESVLVDGRLVAGMLSPERERTNGAVVAPMMLSPGMGSLDFQYTALSYASPQTVLFRHKLDGYDLDWVDGGTARKVHYGRLPAGDYTFRVTARGNDGYWTEEEVSMAFVVLPPVWRTWWFLSLCGLAGVTMFVGTLRMVMLRRLRRRLERAEQQRGMERERTRIARDMHDEIGSKLTRISFLSELVKTKMADSQPIQAIAETSRELLATLDELVWAVNPRNDNLEHLAAYLGHYANEYFQMTPVECRLELPPQIGGCELSSEVRHHLFLAFKESLNNVLKHAHASRVQITMKEMPQLFEIVITDDGRGFDLAAVESGKDGAQRDGNGLLNLRQRLADLGGECQIASAPGAGTTVRLILSLPKNAA